MVVFLFLFAVMVTFWHKDGLKRDHWGKGWGQWRGVRKGCLLLFFLSFFFFIIIFICLFIYFIIYDFFGLLHPRVCIIIGSWDIVTTSSFTTSMVMPMTSFSLLWSSRPFTPKKKNQPLIFILFFFFFFFFFFVCANHSMCVQGELLLLSHTIATKSLLMGFKMTNDFLNRHVLEVVKLLDGGNNL